MVFRYHPLCFYSLEVAWMPKPPCRVLKLQLMLTASIVMVKPLRLETLATGSVTAAKTVKGLN